MDRWPPIPAYNLVTPFSLEENSDGIPSKSKVRPLAGSGLPVCRYPARRHPIIIIGVIPQTRHGRVNFSRVASVRGEDTGLPPTHALLENIVRDRERCIRLSSSTEKIGCISLYERLGRCR